jgi:hypothetical protein
MQEAAAVSADSDNNKQLRAALDACDNMEQWTTALYLFPQALIYDYGSLDRIQPRDEVAAVCSAFPKTRACKDQSLGAYDA